MGISLFPVEKTRTCRSLLPAAYPLGEPFRSQVWVWLCVTGRVLALSKRAKIPLRDSERASWEITYFSSFQLCVISGLLYQEYRDKSTLQEIETRRQQDAEIQANTPGSPASEEMDGEEEEEEDEEEAEGLASPPERKALPQICLLSNPHSRFNLWQDLPEIRSSGVLDMLQPEEIKLQEVRGAGRGRRSPGRAERPRPAGSGRMNGWPGSPPGTCGRAHAGAQAPNSTPSPPGI